MADAGYDVFLANSRGNFYSRKHIYKNPDDPTSGFWDFSFYEMGIYDLPAVIDYVQKTTSNQKVYYIGHSQGILVIRILNTAYWVLTLFNDTFITKGTTSLMTLLSEKPEYNEKIHIASLLAPVGYTNHLDPFIKVLLAILSLLNVNSKQNLL